MVFKIGYVILWAKLNKNAFKIKVFRWGILGGSYICYLQVTISVLLTRDFVYATII